MKHILLRHDPDIVLRKDAFANAFGVRYCYRQTFSMQGQKHPDRLSSRQIPPRNFHQYPAGRHDDCRQNAYTFHDPTRNCLFLHGHGRLPIKLHIENFNALIITHCRNLDDAIHVFTSLLPGFDPSEKQQTDRLMVTIAHSMLSVKQMVFSALSSGEIHGLPREMTTSAMDPDVVIKDSHNPGWDFKPWFHEKLNGAEKAYWKLLRIYETDPESLKLTPGTKRTSVEHAVEVMQGELRIMQVYTKAILDMMESGRLTVSDVRLIL
ncbi:MAG: hypothetical protein K9L21_04420 [Spirochaetia bacterium]|nr:hypothetical protein [Spirochaetia bacterium]